MSLRVEARETEWSMAVVVRHVATVLLIARGVYLSFLEGGSTPAAKLNAVGGAGSGTTGRWLDEAHRRHVLES